MKSEATLNSLGDVFFESYQLWVKYSLTSNYAFDIAALSITLYPLYSVINTNAFQIMKPGSNESEVIMNYYPTNWNAILNNVRKCFNNFYYISIIYV